MTSSAPLPPRAPAVHRGRAFPLVLRAGTRARALLADRGLRAEDVDVLPGASGGAKWLAIAGLDRWLFGEFLRAPRERPLHGIGSSIGSWRLACLAQREPVAALERGHRAYIHEQHYSAKPTVAEITGVLTRALDILLGPTGIDEMLAHPWLRLHVITAQGRGWIASERRALLLSAIAAAAVGNIVARRTLALQLRRFVFHSAGDTNPFAGWSDLPTTHVALTRENARAALMASGSIPLLLHGVRVPGAEGVHWDGGVLDYHLDLDFGAGDGLVLYPHFYGHVVPGWFDKSLSWRRARELNFSRALLIAPSDDFVASLPGARIPDRRDFRALSHGERIVRWERVAAESERLGDAMREMQHRGDVSARLTPWE